MVWEEPIGPIDKVDTCINCRLEATKRGGCLYDFRLDDLGIPEGNLSANISLTAGVTSVFCDALMSVGVRGVTTGSTPPGSTYMNGITGNSFIQERPNPTNVAWQSATISCDEPKVTVGVPVPEYLAIGDWDVPAWIICSMPVDIQHPDQCDPENPYGGCYNPDCSIPNSPCYVPPDNPQPCDPTDPYGGCYNPPYCDPSDPGCGNYNGGCEQEYSCCPPEGCDPHPCEGCDSVQALPACDPRDITCGGRFDPYDPRNFRPI